jgi:SAM-dependent methyltransferase
VKIRDMAELTGCGRCTDCVLDESADEQPLQRLLALGDLTLPFAIGAAAQLEIPARLREPQTIPALAAQTGWPADAMRRLVQVLLLAGIVHETAPGTFSVAATGALLCDDHPYSMRHAYQVLRADVRAWCGLGYALRTGCGAFEKANGESLWQYLSSHAADATRFDRAMEDLSRVEASWLLKAYDWHACGSMLDVGGGNGALVLRVLETLPASRGGVYDLPHVAERARAASRASSAGNRCTVLAGDFFAHVPPGYDTYLLKRIVYSYGDDDALRLLRNVRSAMRAGGRLLLLEPVRRRGEGFEYEKLLDLQMLVVGGGRVRDRHELRALLAGANLRLGRVIPTPLVAVVEAWPV